MINSANQYRISEIFNPDTRVKYFVPKFQREYVWLKKDWDNLYDDLLDDDLGHFLGSIICIDRGDDALGITPLEIIDGQQRLTTIQLFYTAIYSELSQKIGDNDELRNELFNLKYRILQKNKPQETKIELSQQKSNNADFRTILSDVGILTKQPNNLQNVGNRRISRAFQHLKSRLQNKTTEELLDILERINSAILVKIEVSSHSDAFILFESLNDRGVPLSAIDLIKNNTLATLEKHQVMSMDEAFTQWVEITEDLSDYPVQERFLRQFYNAFRYKNTIRQKGVSKATRSNLIKIYDALIQKDVQSIFNDLVAKSRYYHQLIEPKDTEYNPQLKKGLEDLYNVGAAPAYTFLLYLVSEYDDSLALLEQTVGFLVKYFIRRNVTDFPATRDLDNIFIELIDQCELQRQTLQLGTIATFLSDPRRLTSQSRFEERLRGNIYDDNVDAARFVLSKIEEAHMTKETSRDLWKRNEKGDLLWTIEHIFPEGAKIPQEWINMIANGDKDQAKILQEQSVHHLGNLTLSAYNSKLFNYPFEKKRDLVDDRANPIGYKNGMYLNKDLATMHEWNVEAIKHRTNNLVQEALRIFGI